MKTKAILAAVLLLGGTGLADPAMHSFQAWKIGGTEREKLSMYMGWTNGLLYGAGRNADTPKRKETVEGLISCLYRIEYRQAVAMIDKYYNEHPETWTRPLSEQLL